MRRWTGCWSVRPRSRIVSLRVISSTGRWCSMTCRRATSRAAAARWRSSGTPVTGSVGCRRSSTALLCDSHGRPVAVEVFSGELHDDKTLPSQITKLKGRFGLSRVVVVADRGMVTNANIELLVEGRRGRLDHRAESPDDQEARPLRDLPAVAVRRAESRGDHRCRRVPRGAVDRVSQPVGRRPARPQARGAARRDRSRPGRDRSPRRRTAPSRAPTRSGWRPGRR